MLSKYYDLDFFLSHSPQLNEDVEDFKKVFNPISVCNDPIVSDINLDNYPKNFSEHVVRKYAINIIPQFINKMRVFKLLEDHINKNKVDYDYIFSTRVDLFYFNKLTFEEFKEIDDNTIYIPDGNQWPPPMPPGINDHMAIGNLNGMRKYMNVYKYLKTYLDNGCILRPETVLLSHINNMKLNVKYYSRNYCIRSNEEQAKKQYEYYLNYKKKGIDIPNWKYPKYLMPLD